MLGESFLPKFRRGDDREAQVEGPPASSPAPPFLLAEGLKRTFLPHALSLPIWVVYAGLVAWCFFLCPDAMRDKDYLALGKLLSLSQWNPDGVPLNIPFTAVFNFQAVTPTLYLFAMVPTALKSGANGLKFWPFLAGGYLLGIFTIMPFFAMWTPDPHRGRVPPNRQVLEQMPGLKGAVLRLCETRFLPASVLIYSAVNTAWAVLSSQEQWDTYFDLLTKSRFASGMTSDALSLCLFAVPWILYDARERGFPLWKAVPLACVPIFGQLMYFYIRPKAFDDVVGLFKTTGGLGALDLLRTKKAGVGK